MYQQNDYVIYKNYGVYKVSDIGKIKNVNLNPNQVYYTLKSAFTNDVIYALTTAEGFMRHIMNKAEITKLLGNMSSIDAEIISNSNITMLKKQYEAMFDTHQSLDLVKVIKSVKAKNKQARENNKKLSQADQVFLKRAENLLYSEISVAMEIPYDEVGDFIQCHMANA